MVDSDLYTGRKLNILFEMFLCYTNCYLQKNRRLVGLGSLQFDFELNVSQFVRCG